MQYKAQGRRAQDCRVLFAWDIIAEDRESSRSMDSIAVNAQKKLLLAINTDKDRLTFLKCLKLKSIHWVKSSSILKIMQLEQLHEYLYSAQLLGKTKFINHPLSVGCSVIEQTEVFWKHCLLFSPFPFYFQPPARD